MRIIFDTNEKGITIPKKVYRRRIVQKDKDQQLVYKLKKVGKINLNNYTHS